MFVNLTDVQMYDFIKKKEKKQTACTHIGEELCRNRLLSIWFSHVGKQMDYISRSVKLRLCH